MGIPALTLFATNKMNDSNKIRWGKVMDLHGGASRFFDNGKKSLLISRYLC
jgi:hypothetical protein